ncbi:(d)CMP kinase [bacterium]|nr:(d)CMP kinase [bacterium]
MIIAIDGPAGAGKSTLAKNLARHLKILYLDTGATYRAAALFAIEEKIDLDNPTQCAELVNRCDIGLQTMEDGKMKVLLNGRNVSDEIRKNEVSNAASRISVHSEVRHALVDLQRRIAENKDVVAEGRDIGSVVFPNADLKIYLDAPLNERAERRINDYIEMGEAKSVEEIEEEMSERDNRDMTRDDSPLVCVKDAVYINNGRFQPEDTLNAVLQVIESMRR